MSDDVAISSDEEKGLEISRRRLIGTAAGGAAVAAGLASPGVAGAARSRRRADVVVVGAGFAGLTTALGLVAEGKSVIVLEARDRVGGRAHNIDIGGGDVSERGATFVGPTQNRILKMAKRFGVDTFPTYVEGQNVYVDANGNRSLYTDAPPFGNAPPDPVTLADLTLAVTQLDEMSTEVPVSAPWDAPQAAEWDSITLDQWIKDNTVTPQFSDLVALATRPIFGAEPRELSLLFTLFYIAASGNQQNAGTFERNFNTKGGAQEQRMVGGTQRLAKLMARRLGDRVVLGAPVGSISQDKGGVTVRARGVTVRARRAVVAMPPALAARITFRPGVPVPRDQLCQRLPMGFLMKATCIYKRPFWRDDGLSGAAVSYDGPVQVTYDDSPEDGNKGVLFGFVGGEQGRRWRLLSRAERRAAVLANFTKYFGPKAAHPVRYYESDWPGQRWSRGSPVAIAGPGALLAYGPALVKPFRRLHWAGTEQPQFWTGYMDGAVRSGERAAAAVLADL